jgi:hypothetical protein
MNKTAAYFSALLTSSIIGSALNISYWYIEERIDPNFGYSYSFEFYFLFFLISVFFSFIAALPVFGLIFLVEKKSGNQHFWLIFLLTYLVYFAFMYFFFRFRDKDALIGYHIYALTVILSSYYFMIYRNKLPINYRELLDN